MLCKCYRGDVTVKRDSGLDSLLESEGDTEDDEETDGACYTFTYSVLIVSHFPNAMGSLMTL